MSKSTEDCCTYLRWHRTMLLICCRHPGASVHVLHLASLRLRLTCLRTGGQAGRNRGALRGSGERHL